MSKGFYRRSSDDQPVYWGYPKTATPAGTYWHVPANASEENALMALLDGLRTEGQRERDNFKALTENRALAALGEDDFKRYVEILKTIPGKD